MHPLFLILSGFILASSSPLIFAQRVDELSDEESPPPLKGEKFDQFDFAAIAKGTGILPIPNGPDKTEKLETIAARKRQRLIRVIVEPAKARMKGAAYAADAGTFLTDMADYLAWLPTKDATPMILQGRRLSELGCNDPAFLCWMGIALKATGKEGDAWFSSAFNEAVRVNENIGEIGLSAYTRMSIRTPADETKAILLGWLKQVGAEKDHDDESRELAKMLFPIVSSLQGRDMDDSILDVLKNSALPAWVKQTLIGRMEIKLAWRARGSDWAAKVTDNGWDGFSEHLKKARAALTSAWEANPDQPYAAASMITVTMGDKSGDIAELQKWLHRSVAADFDQSDAYEFFLSAIRPRWGGSAGHVLTFGKACMDTGRYETQVPKFFLSSLEAIANDLPDWRILFAEPAIKKQIDSFFETSLSKITDPKARSAEHGQAGVFAWFTGDFKKADAHFTQGTFSTRSAAADLMKRASTDIFTVSRTSRILAGEGAKDFLAARDAMKGGKWDDAIDFLQRCAEKYKTSQTASPYIKTQIAIANFERGLDTGKWTPLPIAADFPSWTALTGKWTVQPGSIQLRGDGKAAKLIFDGTIPDEFEMRGNYAFSSATPGKVTKNIGFILRHTGIHNTAPSKTWNSVRMWGFLNGSQSVDIRRMYSLKTDTIPEPITCEFPDSGTFIIRRTTKGAGLTLNEKSIFNDQRLPDDEETGRPHIGFGTIRSETGVTVEFTNLEMRKL